MRFFTYFNRALAFCLGAALWTGCGAQQPSASTMPPPAVRSAGHLGAAHNISSENLLYVTGACGGICVFTYPGGALVQQLSDSKNPYGECVDKAGDVFVADFGSGTGIAAIREYAHGGTTPIGSLSDPGYRPQACSIDPTTGNLAVTNEYGPVAIYARAKGDPRYFTYSQAYLNGFCAYDAKGNLFVDGYSVGGGYALVEMPKDSDQFKNVKLNIAPSAPLDIQWAGKYLAVADSGTLIYRVAISSGNGTVIGSTVLNGPVSGIEVQFWIQGGTIIQPYGRTGLPDEVGLWKYPTGGKPRKRIDVSQSELFGTVVSPATSR